MNTILKRLQKTDVAMEDPAIRVQLGLKLKQQSIKAIMGGIGSPDWEAYMSLFAENKAQLTRLTVPSDGEEPWLPEARAYMVANAVCGADSTTRTSLRVDDGIDDNVSLVEDGKIRDPLGEGEVLEPDQIARPFKLPI